MIKILSAAQTREADAYTIQNEPVSSAGLMERAAGYCSGWLRQELPANRAVFIFCGPGNNGGDGLVIARHLARDGFETKVWLVSNEGMRPSDDHQLNLSRLEAQKSVPVRSIGTTEDFPDIPSGSIVIDALFGSGLSRPPQGLMAEVIEMMNRSEAIRIAIDLPSGLYADAPSGYGSRYIVYAHHTLSFLPPKLSLLVPEHEIYTGHVHYFDIGIHPGYLEKATTSHYLLSQPDISARLKRRSRFGHKGTYGHALIIAGSEDKAGAALLSAKACLSSGAGLVTAHLPAASVPSLNSYCPEIMVSPREPEHQSELPPIEKFSAVGAGPGIGTSDEAALLLKNLIHWYSGPLVLDADALNILSENPTWLAFLRPGTILTPHPGEFERLAGKSADSFEALSKQKNLSVKYQLIIIRKGAHTSITTPDGATFLNNTGNPGMATAGSGDVLTGMLTGLLAQGYAPVDAAITGTWLHGMAGDLALDSHSPETLTAGALIENLHKAFSISAV